MRVESLLLAPDSHLTMFSSATYYHRLSPFRWHLHASYGDYSRDNPSHACTGGRREFISENSGGIYILLKSKPSMAILRG